VNHEGDGEEEEEENGSMEEGENDQVQQGLDIYEQAKAKQ